MIDKQKCTGCTACKYICPTSAIDIKVDDLTGFHTAVVNKDICVGCNKCEQICPNNNQYINTFTPQRFALRMFNPITKICSSGGAYILLARYYVNRGYKIVGVKWDDDFNASYDISDDPLEFCGSKYMQPNIHQTFSQVKNELDNNGKILFVGLPCHTAGLLNYLGKTYENLITVNLLCRCIPSPKIWQKWLNENGFDTSNIKSINMRFKDGHSVYAPVLRIVMNDDSVHHFNLKSTTFYRLSMMNGTLSNSQCSNCLYKNITNHNSDYTIGDLWGAKHQMYWDDNESNLSFLSCNNEEALKSFSKIKRAYQKNIVLCTPIKFGGNFKDFSFKPNMEKFEKIDDISLIDIAKKMSVKNKPYDVALAGGTMCNNFGGALTYYALYKYIKTLGLKPVIIPPPKDSLGIILRDNIFVKHCNVAPNYYDNNGPHQYNDLSNTFMIGSDQMWNYNLFKEWKFVPYLDYVHDEAKKIAYGVSMGTTSYSLPAQPVQNHIKYLIQKFDHISCREPLCNVVINDFYDRSDTTTCIDPVFLCHKKIYEDLIKESNVNIDGDYICSYMLSNNDKLLKMSNSLSIATNLPNIMIGTGNAKKFENLKFQLPNISFVNPISVQDWLYYIKNAKYVITDSFHGICFSIIFGKQFYVPIKQDDARIHNILSICGLTDMSNGSTDSDAVFKLMKNIKYDEVYKRLRPHITESKLWLKKALNKYE